MKEIAHFFWDKNDTLTQLELTCISSFIKNGFKVYVWSYNHLDLPENCILKDAAEILDENVFNTRFNNADSSFQDLFRLKLLLKYGGWWFDTDMVCLRNESEFKKLKENKRIVAGLEDSEWVNNAALYFNDTELLESIIKYIEECMQNVNGQVIWGYAGPRGLTRFLKENNMFDLALETYYFYPVYHGEIDMLFNNDFKSLMRKCKKSYTIHLWNHLISKNLNSQKELPEDAALSLLLNRN
jgi:hypothetical protein